MANVAIEDLSGLSIPLTGNPLDGLIDASKGDPQRLQDFYRSHRVTRNEQQRRKILDDDFSGWILDEYLVKLDGHGRDPSFADPRNCLVFWARPPVKVRNLIGMVQQKLREFAPDLWLMPLDNLHMTAMEVAHSMTAKEIDRFVNILLPAADDIANLTRRHRARLIRPMVSYDSAALALSFLPAAGESVPVGRDTTADSYSYHHLRRDVHGSTTDAGVKVASRYVVPSAHLTIARYNTLNVFGGDVMDAGPTHQAEKRHEWIGEIDKINEWLEVEYWPQDEGPVKPGGEWIVGEEKGLDFRRGLLWYGGGETVQLGEGF